jgi:hypothetical protein
VETETETETDGRDRMTTETETETAGTPATGTGPSAPETGTGTALTATARAALAAQLTGRTNRLFYFVVLAVALVGSSTAAREWLLGDPEAGKPAPWWFLPLALVAVAVYELGAVAVSRFADQRRRLGERALVARLASAALAGGAIAAQYLGHQPDLGPAAFFAGVSLTGYVIYLLEAAASRRDALRRDGKLADTPPAYGLAQWTRHPWITRRARALALANAENRLQDAQLPALGRVASLAAAAEQVRAERRLAAIEDALRTRIAAGVDPTMAKIAVNTYDMPTVAAGIAAAADYPALTRIITAELVPARLVKLDDAARDAQAAAVAAAAITEHVATAVAAVAPAPAETAPPAPALEAAPPAPAAAAVPPPPAPETDPVSPPAEAETAPVPTPEPVAETETAPAPPVRRFVRMDPLPPPLSSLRDAAQRPPAEASPEPETAPVPAAVPAQPAPPAAETEPETATDDKASEQGETGETDTETDETAHSNGVDPLAGVEAKLLPYLRLVMAAHRDWAIDVRRPERHPEALTVTKIKVAAKITGKALGCSIKKALEKLAEHPETAEAALRSRQLTAAGAS